ncbi:MAG: hypothetical protein CMN73_04400 [Sphingomonas sp.]|nr:hypothetical protein [Sphingomonas sp.]
MATEIAYRFKLAGYSAAAWTAENPVLLEREVGLELDTMRLKIGDGSTAWNSLDYWSQGTTAAQVSVTPTGYQVITATDAQTAFDQIDQALLNARSTGIRYGGALSDLGSGVVRIAAGQGGILDNSDPADPQYSSVNWVQTDIDLSATDTVHYVYVNASGTVTSTTTPPSHSEYRTAIWLHRVSIRSGAYSASTSIVQPLQQYGPQIWDIWRALGLIKRGLEVQAASTDLTLLIGAGEIYQAGANFYDNPLVPAEVEYPAKNPVTFRHVDQDGDQSADRTTLDVGNYDASGTVTAIPGSSARASIFQVMQFPGSGGNVRIFYGQAWYNNVTDALEALSTGAYIATIPESYSENAITLGWIIAEKGATDLSDGVQIFVQSGRFGTVSGAVANVGLGGFVEALALGEPGVQTNSGDADFSIAYQADKRTIRLTGTITADRALTLSTTNARDGGRFRIVRTGAGAFVWNIGSGPLKAMPAASWCDVEYDGAAAAWFLAGYGTL